MACFTILFGILYYIVFIDNYELEKKKTDVIKMTLTEVCDKLDRTNDQYNSVKTENEKLRNDVKAAQADNALLFKKVVNLQDQLVSMYNSMHEESKTPKQSDSADEFEVTETEMRERRTQSCFVKHHDLDLEVEKEKDDQLQMISILGSRLPTKALHKKIVDEAEVSALAYNFRGDMVAWGSSEGCLKIYEPLHGSDVRTLKNFNKGITTITFSTDSQNLIAAYLDGTIRVWRLDSMKPVNNFYGHSDMINCSSYSHTSDSLITGSSDRSVKLWDITKGIANKTFPGWSTCYSVDAVPYGSVFATGHNDGTVKFWTPNNKTFIKSVDAHVDSVTSVNFSGDGRFLMSTSRDHTIKLIDIRYFDEICMFESDHYVNGSNTSRSAVSPSGDYAVIGSNNGSVIVLKLLNDEVEIEEIYNKEHISWVNTCAWQPTGGSFATADNKGCMLIWQ